MSTVKTKNVNVLSLLKDTKAVKQATHKVTVLFNDDGTPRAGFLIVGPNSTELAEANRSIRVSNISKSSARQKSIDAKTEEGATLVVDNLEESDHTRAVAVTVGWFGFGDEENEAPFDKEQAAELLKTFPMWQALVLSQLEVDSNFMKV